jgi:3,4-dihydroxyphenylacetate 2,3-dioxygenase
MSLVGAYLSVHTPRYCTLAAAFEGTLASEVFRPVRDGLVAQGREVAKARLDAMVINSCHLITTFPTVVDGTPRHRGVLTAQEAPEIIHGVGYDIPGDYELAASIVARGGQRDSSPCSPMTSITHSTTVRSCPWCAISTVRRSCPPCRSPCVSARISGSPSSGGVIPPMRRGRAGSGWASWRAAACPTSWSGARRKGRDPRTRSSTTASPKMLAAGAYRQIWQWLPEFARVATPEMGGRHLAMMLGAIIESGETFETSVHAYGPSSGSGNYVISLLAHGGQA